MVRKPEEITDFANRSTKESEETHKSSAVTRAKNK